MAVELFLVAIVLALLFDFINGFHDSANAVATVIATRVLTPVQAVLMAGAFNFVGPFIFSLAVANTVGKGIIEKDAVSAPLIIGALVGAIFWNLLTWWIGMPSSSSHALTGGLVGAGFAAAGFDAVFWPVRSEAFALAEYALYGAVGGAAVGVLLWPISRTKVPRSMLPLFVVAGALWFGFVGYHGNVIPFDHGFQVAVKPVLVNFVYVLLGVTAGALLWAGTQQPLSIRDVPLFIVPGAAGTIAVATLMKKIVLGGFTKVLVFMIVSPVLGFTAGFMFYAATQWLWRNTRTPTVNAFSRKAQLGSSAFYALMHGTNDAQKTMGIIGVLLYSQSIIGLDAANNLELPIWVIVASALAMGVGTAFGGWRIVKTMASRLTHLRPHQGFAAETAGGVVLVAMAEAGIPVSTTHAISSSIMGVGATRRASAVRWNVGRQMFMAWIVTIPCSGIVSWLSYHVLNYFL